MRHNDRKVVVTAPAKQNTQKVGFFGCTDQVVRVSCVVATGKRAVTEAWVDCPACGQRHPAKELHVA